jgi:scyllo-inositol 2-dehydrogenase (NAD+)
VSRLRVALIGAGRAGSVHAGNLADYAARAEVVAVVDERREAAEALGPSSGLDEALERADAVVITAPTFAHRDLAVRAASAGKHVFCEKPMALTVAECDEMIEAAQSAGVVLQIGFMRRFQPEFVEARRRIEAGDVGEPMLIKSLTRGPGLPPAWAWDLERSNGMLAEVNSHDFDSVRWLAGSEIERVYAEVAHLKGRERGVEADDFYDNAVVSLRFESGALGTIDGTCPADYGYDARVEIVCSEGLLIVGDLRGQAIVEVRDRDVGTVTPLHRTWPERCGDAYRAESRSFVDCALDGAAPVVTGADGRAAVVAVRAATRSWQEGRAVALAQEAAV